jgi:anti-sigma-K factor RskA
MNAPHLSDDNLALLTAYALDALAPDEIIQVHALLEEQPELHTLVAELRAVSDMLPAALPESEPDPQLRERTLAYALGRAPRVTAQQPNRLRRWVFGLGSIAAASLVVAGLLWGQLAATSAELDAARAALQVERDRNTLVTAALASGQPIAALSGPGGSGSVISAPDGQVLVTARLPPLAQGRVYQLWQIEGSSAPVSAGTFTVGPDGVGSIRATASAANTYAVTDEPEGGSPGPTTPVLLSGQLPAT